MHKVKELKLQVIMLKEKGQFIAYSPALDLSTSAQSFEKVKRRFEEIVQVFFEEASEMGTLEEVLEGLGWKKQKQEWLPPMIISQGIESIKIPAYH